LIHYNRIDYRSLEDHLFKRFDIDGFLSLKDLPSPNRLKDMERATKRVKKAIDSGEKIVVIGDYDVDGVVSTTIMKLFFDEIDVPLKWIIPNRFRDGYGLSPTLIPQIEGYDLVITVDNGISAVDAALICSEKGIDLIITDHHLLPPKVPKAYAIIDQKQSDCDFPYDDICGAQIAWYLIASLKNSLRVDIDIKSYLQFVSIAIVADMMPLMHINRAMVVAGMQLLDRSTIPSIRAFKEHLDKETFVSDDIGFQISPILNSAGRMDDASYAVEFLISKNIYDARIRLQKLVDFNNSRKEIEYDITQKAIEKADIDSSVIVVEGEDWNEGVVGIVAARVSRHFEKPAIVLTRGENGNYKGSGRSFSECNLFEITSNCREYLEKFGGHQAAIGLSLLSENLDNFKKKLEISYRDKNYNSVDIDPDIVGELDFRDISFDLVDLISRYEPYGQKNVKPKFISSEIKIVAVDTMGKSGEHLRFALESSGVILVGVKFKSDENFEIGDLLQITYTINKNEFRDRVSLQLMIDKITKL